MLEEPEQRQIYFSGNEASDQFQQGQDFIQRNVNIYNKSIENNEVISQENNEEDTNKFMQIPKLFDKLVGNNKRINKIFNLAWQDVETWLGKKQI